MFMKSTQDSNTKGRENCVFPVAGFFKPMGLKTQSRLGGTSSEIQTAISKSLREKPRVFLCLHTTCAYR